MIWNPTKECMSRDQMRELQGKRLHKIVEYVYHNVPFYREKLQQMVYAEGTTVIPMIASYVYHNGPWKKREYKNWQSIYQK